MRVLVCGGRNFADRDLLTRTLNSLAKANVIDAVIEGNARGADRMAGYWARNRCIYNQKFGITSEEWNRLGSAAGPIRNARMLAEGCPDLVVAFQGGRGTADIVRQARSAGVPVMSVP